MAVRCFDSSFCDSSTSPWCHPNTPATVSTQSNECDSSDTKQTPRRSRPLPSSILAGRFVAVVLFVNGTHFVRAPGLLCPKGLDKAMGDRQKALQPSSLRAHSFRERGCHRAPQLKRFVTGDVSLKVTGYLFLSSQSLPKVGRKRQIFLNGIT